MSLYYLKIPSFSQSAFLIWTSCTFIQIHKIIIETKKMRVLKSKTPIWILLKWDRKDIEPIVSVTQVGVHDLTDDKTRLKPAIIKTNPLIEEIINEITWFLVSADKQEVRAKKAPAINQLPIYDIKITLLSGSPR